MGSSVAVARWFSVCLWCLVLMNLLRWLIVLVRFVSYCVDCGLFIVVLSFVWCYLFSDVVWVRSFAMWFYLGVDVVDLCRLLCVTCWG